MRAAYLPPLLLMAVLAAPATALAAPSLAEFSTGTRPTAVAQGAEGDIWYTLDGSRGAIGRITSDGTDTIYTNGLSSKDRPVQIAAGPGGVWFTEDNPGDDDKIARITSGGTVREFEVGAHDGPAGIVAGPDGNLWYTATGQGGAIVRMTTTGTVTEFTAGLTTDGAPHDIALGADGNLWFTLPGTRRIGRITPQGTITEFGSGVLTGAPQEIAPGPDGTLWFTQTGMTPSIGRITTAGAIAQFSSGLAIGSAPQGITAGADGNMYFTDPGAPSAGQVTPSGAISRYGPTFSAGSDPQGITTGGDGRLWFAARGVARIGRLSVAPTPGAVGVANTTATSAALSSTVNPNSQATTYSFEWGTTPTYGQSTTVASVASGTTAQSVSASLTTLSAGTQYHARLIAANATGTSYGPDRAFTTAAVADPQPVPAAPTAPATQVPGAPSATAPEPVVGRTAVASVVRGTILVRRPGSSSSRVLGADSAIPSGAVVDARKGTIALESAVDATGRTQRALFRGALFSMRLSRRDTGYVDLRLTQAPTGCPSSRGLTARAATAPKAPIRLWGSDRKGKYRTHGRNSVATVRGTEWTTSETCAGTLTRVMSGAVSVRDVRTRKRTLVRAGHAFLAHPRG